MQAWLRLRLVQGQGRGSRTGDGGSAFGAQRAAQRAAQRRAHLWQ